MHIMDEKDHNIINLYALAIFNCPVKRA